MSALLVALLVVQAGDPIGWVIIPKVSAVQSKLAAGPLRVKSLPPSVTAKAVNDTVLVTYDISRQPSYVGGDQSRYLDDPATAQAAALAPNADLRFVLDGQRAVQAIEAPSSASFSVPRAMQRLGLDNVKLVLGDVTLGSGTVHIDALATYPPPRSGVVEALGPAVTAAIPAWVPKSANVICISVQPSAVFNQGNMAFASADPMDQAIVNAHLRGLETQIGKRLSDDALGATPRLWTVYGKGVEAVSVLEVADVGVLKRFLDSYADAIPALLPGTTVERQKLAGHEAVSVTLPSKKTFALAFAKNAVVVAATPKLLQAHFAAKGRGKASPLGPPAVAYGTTNELTDKAATWTMVLTDPGLRFAADVKAR